MKKVFLILLATVLAISMVAVGCPDPVDDDDNDVEVIQWEGVCSWPPGTLLHDMAVNLAEAIEQESDGRIQVTLLGPDAWPGPQQIEAVQDGVFDFCSTTTSYHLGYMPAGLFTAFMGGYRDDLRALGAHDLIDELYREKFNATLIATFNEGYAHLFVFFREPVETLADFAGRTIRSADLWHPAIVEWGAEPIWMSDPEAIDALNYGTIDGATTVTLNYVELGYTEVAPYLVYPPVSGTYYYNFANVDSWNALPADLQEAVRRARTVAEAANDALIKVKLAQYPPLWEAAGVQYVILSEEDALAMTSAAQEAYLEATVRPSVDDELYQKIKGMIEASPPIVVPSEIVP